MSVSGFQEKLLQLRQEYAELLPQKLKDIDNAWTSLHNRPNQPELWRQFRAFVHTLAGSGATFGFPELSAQASRLEGLIDGVAKDLSTLEQVAPALSGGVLALHRAAQTRETAQEPVPAAAEAPRTASTNLFLGKQVFWVGGNPLVGQALASQLECFTYRTSLFIEPADLWAALAQTKPNVVLLDLGEAAEARYSEAFSVLERLSQLAIPVIALCPSDYDLAHWLQVIRAGATTCLNRPLVLYKLLEKLDSLTFHWAEPPARLFIIDDDVALAKNMALILTKAGMQVSVETNALEVPRSLERFHPDLILVDLYMPECNGIELSRLIRQDPRYLAVPIVYLSAETEVHQRLAALEAGADDFILKPVKLNFLYQALSSRIKRARQLQNLYERDVLTGLYRHTVFQQRLREHLVKANREQHGLVVALADIDRFKAINEHHGHELGDKVLHLLAIMLKRRFALNAELCRFDGATLALAFPSAELEAVRAAMDQAREDFQRVEHDANGLVFEASFSVGLAAFPNFHSAIDLLDACHKALMRAKTTGRNRVERLIDTSGLSSSSEGQVPVFISESDDEANFLVEEDDLFSGEPTEQPQERAPSATAQETGVTVGGVSEPQVEPKIRGKIVVVDDDKQLLSVMVSFLSANGFDAVGADNGEDGFKKVLEHKPELVLIDLLLFPGIHGFELCKKIKHHPQLKETSIILMTAVYKDYRYQLEGKEAGGDAFVIKPINFEELMARIEEVKSKRR